MIRIISIVILLGPILLASGSPRMGTVSSTLYREHRSRIMAFELRADDYYRAAKAADDCFAELNDIIDQLEGQGELISSEVRELIRRKGRLSTHGNLLASSRSQIFKDLRCILGDSAPIIYDYYHAIHTSLRHRLDDAQACGDWREASQLLRASRRVERDKKLIVDIFVHERTAGSDSLGKSGASGRSSSQFITN